VAKRKTLFDDRPVEISVRVPLCSSSLPQILKNIF
jgi:syntaxin 5